MHAAVFRVLPTTQVSETNQVSGTPYTVGSTILSGATLSGVIDAQKCLVCNITAPSNLRGVTTVTITHSDQPDGTFTTLTTLSSGAADYTITLTASKTIPLDTGLTAGLGYIKLVPNTAPNADLVLKIGVKEAA